MRNRFMVAGLLALAAFGARPAFAGAWPVTHQWNEKARPGDPTSGSFAWEYGAAAVALVTSITRAGDAMKLDCADTAIVLLVDYAAKNGLEVQFTLPDPDNKWKTRVVSSTEARFKSHGQFLQFSRNWINARMVATLNTSSIPREKLRAGDLFLMKWSQLGPALDPFPGRDVWHTYVVGEPDKLLFYGNDSADLPLPVTATAESRRLEDVRSSPAIYEGLPRRWNLLKDAMVPPEKALASVVSPLAPQEATVTANNLNVRLAPSTAAKVRSMVKRGDKLVVEGKTADGWVRVRFPDFSVGYVFGPYVTVAGVEPRCYVEKDWVPPSNVNGITNAIGN